jgi:hypothetical protein
VAWCKNMNRSSLIKKVFGTALILGFSWLWYLQIVDEYLETVSIKCQPSPVQVICRISNEPYLGGRSLEVSKTQLTGTEYLFRAMEGSTIQWIALTMIDEKIIILNRSPGGKIIRQLVKYKAQIAKFIADPQAKTLSIETHRRDINLQMQVVTGGIILFSCLCLKKLWIVSR